MEKEYIVVVKTHRMGGHIASWSEKEIRAKAEQDYEYEDSWDFDACCQSAFGDSYCYRIFDPQDYQTVEAFIEDVANFAEHGHAALNLERTYWNRENLASLWRRKQF